MSPIINVMLVIAVVILAWNFTRAIVQEWLEVKNRLSGRMRYFWYSPGQEQVMEFDKTVEINGQHVPYSECTRSKTPFGKWGDYEFMGIGNLDDCIYMRAYR